jgi:hypothetical protein
MRWGWHDDRFYFEWQQLQRPWGNMREESEHRARELYGLNPKILLSVSSGIDSQSMIHSFITQAIPFTAVFMFMPNYNNQELKNLRVLEQRWGFRSEIVTIDPIAQREAIERVSAELNAHPIAILHQLFLDQLPRDHDFVQMTHDPFVYVSSTGRRYYLQSYHDMPTTKQRVFDLVDREGCYRSYGDTTEFLLSIIDDPIYRAAITAHSYYDHNGLTKPKTKLTLSDRYDYYIKPLLYGRYWGDELVYFGKRHGAEEIPYLSDADHDDFRKLGILVPVEEFVRDLKTSTRPVRYYHNMPDFQIL